ncbi:MAG: hypothetical protein KAS32_22060 [Candidatus Peribacteraceae bacterium]|nr:hypothetical protein [Candidatus Peribacteraceae bacterium]
MTTLIVIVCLFVVGCVAFIMIKSTQKKAELAADVIAVAEEVPIKKQAPQSDVEVLVQKLIDLNIKIRTNPIHLDIRRKLESNFDLIRRLLPVCNEKYAGTELTYVINAMVNEYIPKMLHQFMDLQPESREESRAKFEESLDTLTEKLNKIDTLIENQEVGEFDGEAAFIKERFFQGITI